MNRSRIYLLVSGALFAWLPCASAAAVEPIYRDQVVVNFQKGTADFAERLRPTEQAASFQVESGAGGRNANYFLKMGVVQPTPESRRSAVVYDESPADATAATRTLFGARTPVGATNVLTVDFQYLYDGPHARVPGFVLGVVDTSLVEGNKGFLFGSLGYNGHAAHGPMANSLQIGLGYLNGDRFTGQTNATIGKGWQTTPRIPPAEQIIRFTLALTQNGGSVTVHGQASLLDGLEGNADVPFDSFTYTVPYGTGPREVNDFMRNGFEIMLGRNVAGSDTPVLMDHLTLMQTLRQAHVGR